MFTKTHASDWTMGGLCACVVAFLLAGTAPAIVIETVPVGNVGNTGEWSGEGYGGFGTPRICGAVDYEYEIGKYEVTAAQYCDFLNAVAKTDTYGLYNPLMDRSPTGCQITQHGTEGSFTYDFSGGAVEAPGSMAADWQNRPVNYVSWGDAARFANWLNNGQPSGEQNLSTTEDGAYFLNGATTDEQLVAVIREADWQWAVPTEDEWYKAAYHKNDGDTGNYYDYPTSNGTAPSNELPAPDPGNTATFHIATFPETIGAPYWRTEVGAHDNSPSPYGTFDQGGNVYEWNEDVEVFVDQDEYDRGLRGGSFDYYRYHLTAAVRNIYGPSQESDSVGFRVSNLPEPCTLSMLALGAFAVLRRRNS